LKDWFGRLGLLLLGGLGGLSFLMLVEAGLNRFAPRRETYPTGFYRRDEHVGWIGVPNLTRRHRFGAIKLHVDRNSHGFRDRERTYRKNPGVFRIVVLGDSFTEGIQVRLDKVFPSVLERQLNAEGNIRYEVLNLGITSFGTDQEYLALQHYGLRYDPDLVVLAFFTGNDIRENSYAINIGAVVPPNCSPGKPYFVLKNGDLVLRPLCPVSSALEPSSPASAETTGTGLARRRLRESMAKFFPNIYYTAKDAVASTPWLEDLFRKAGLKTSSQEAAGGTEAQDKIMTRVLLNQQVYAVDQAPEWRDAWQVTRQLVRRMSEDLRQRNIRFLVVIIPNEFEFRPLRLAGLPGFDTFKFDLLQPERMLCSFLEREGIPQLVLRPEFEKYTFETGKDLYLRDDGHWNAAGHALVADLLRERMRDSRLLRWPDKPASNPSTCSN